MGRQAPVFRSRFISSPRLHPPQSHIGSAQIACPLGRLHAASLLRRPGHLTFKSILGMVYPRSIKCVISGKAQLVRGFLPLQAHAVDVPRVLFLYDLRDVGVVERGADAVFTHEVQ